MKVSDVLKHPEEQGGFHFKAVCRCKDLPKRDLTYDIWIISPGRIRILSDNPENPDYYEGIYLGYGGKPEFAESDGIINEKATKVLQKLMGIK